MAVMMRKSLAFAVIFAISLVINLFLMGLVTGLYLQRPFHPDRPIPPPLFFHPPTILKALPETQERLSPILHQHASTVHEKIEKLHQARRAVHRQIKQDRLNREALEATLLQLRRAELEKDTVFHQIFAEMMSRLTKEERQRLREIMPPNILPPHPPL